AGIRPDAAARFTRWIGDAGLADRLGGDVRIFVAADLDGYFTGFNQLLAETDILWTKPSEMTFFGALGIPLVFSHPVGMHERYNRRWAIENGAGLKQREPGHAGYWIREWLAEGTLAAAAWSGFMRLPKFGLFHVLERVTSRGAQTTLPSMPPGASASSSTSASRFQSPAPSGLKTRM
ncbi:MAG TPA: hypothetical protein VE075_10915, partial [Thermoanaerobaculia bacterium]|nr:hypothetical protein [Thermoanaerobaculia bacterium]